MKSFNPLDVRVGDVIQLPWVRSYQHGATMIVLKVNRATVEAREIAGSYGGPITAEQFKTTHSHCGGPREGRLWRVHKHTEGLRHPYNWKRE